MFIFIRIENTNLVCYPNGTILRFDKRSKKWTVCKGSKSKAGYLVINIDRKIYLIHRVLAHAFGILDLHSLLEIDHIDRNPLNNCIENLRPATRQQNNFNTNAKGYCWSEHYNKWIARIVLDKTQIHLGYFDKEEEAHQAYLDAKEIYHKF